MENKKILLVHPEISRTKYDFGGIIDNEPLELEYIWAMLKDAGYEPYIWDGQVEKMPFLMRLNEIKPAAVYICGRTRQEYFMKEYCRSASKLGCITMIGGLHAQHCYKRFYENYVDYVFRSFDIFGILNVLENRALDTVNGLCRRDGSKWVENKTEPFDISRLPRPDRTYFYQHPRYRYLELQPCAHVRTAYCCPYRCKFCYRNSLNCGKYVTRDIADVVDEIAGIECDNIYIIDDDFLFNEKRLQEFIRLVRERGIQKKYVCYGRADFISTHRELMEELKDIGFYYVLVGLEATDDKHLFRYNKKSDLHANGAAVDILNELGINTMGMFIVDLDFKPGDFRAIARWVRRHKLKHAAISIFTPEMSSELYEEYRSRLITRDPSHWDYLHVVAKPKYMSVKRYYMHYHILIGGLFLRAWRQGIYDFIDYKFFIKSIVKNMFRFGG
ncbi:radical SAM protein [uncultured Ruminococcus sp.]|uniref:B12-binding domain-containing radical SAM protein n=1 Tax=uncultured Ruminococcus sp. TaxID=165186 RepID=UPI0025DE375B|nr:radical SAM protein [uncultured Ruminococcus sp.]